MKKIITILLTAVLILIFTGCACKHKEWKEATCVEPRTCIKCGETEGEALGHDWVDATCTKPKTCSICGEIEGKALGHNWVDATCTEAKTCSVCGETEGEALGHDWTDATCTEAKTCSVCGATVGKELGHNWIDATCTEPKTCSVCGETEGEALGHDWTDATCTEPKTCSVCGETEGEALGHDWVDATCTEPKTCSICGEIEGKALGHDWVDATCMEAKICSVCGETEGEALGHTWMRPTCSNPKTCVICGETEGAPLGHDWESATYRDPKTCKICGATEGTSLNTGAKAASEMKLDGISFLLKDGWIPSNLGSFVVFNSLKYPNSVLSCMTIATFDVYKTAYDTDGDYETLANILQVPIDSMSDMQTMSSDGCEILTAKAINESEEIEMSVACVKGNQHTYLFIYSCDSAVHNLSEEERSVYDILIHSIQLNETKEDYYERMYRHCVNDPFDEKTAPYLYELSENNYKDSADILKQKTDSAVWELSEFLINTQSDDTSNDFEQVIAGSQLCVHFDAQSLQNDNSIEADFRIMIDLDSDQSFEPLMIKDMFKSGAAWWPTGIHNAGTVRITFYNAKDDTILGYKEIEVVEPTNAEDLVSNWTIHIDCINTNPNDSTTNLDKIPVHVPAYIHFTADCIEDNQPNLLINSIYYYPDGTILIEPNTADVSNFNIAFSPSQWVRDGGNLNDSSDPLLQSLSVEGTVKVEFYEHFSGLLIAETEFERVSEIEADEDWSMQGPINSSYGDHETNLATIPCGQPVIGHFPICGTAGESLDYPIRVTMVNSDIISVDLYDPVPEGEIWTFSCNEELAPGDKVSFELYNAKSGKLLAIERVDIIQTLSKENTLPKEWTMDMYFNSDTNDDSPTQFIQSGNALVCHYTITDGPNGFSLQPEFKVYYTDGDITTTLCQYFRSIGSTNWWKIQSEYKEDWGKGTVTVEAYDHSSGKLVGSGQVTIW